MGPENYEPHFSASVNPNPILRVDLKGILKYANPAAKSLLDAWQINSGDTVPENVLHALNVAVNNQTVSELEVVLDSQVFLLNFKYTTNSDYVDIYGFDSSMHKKLLSIDPISHCPNRTTFIKKFGDLLLDNAQENIYLVLLNINEAVSTSQNYDLEISDALMHQVSLRIKNTLVRDELIGSMSYREFSIVIQSCGSEDETFALVSDLISELMKPFNIKNQDIFIHPSAGISTYPKDSKEHGKLISYASLALTKAHSEPENIQFYRTYMGAINQAKHLLSREIHKAIAQNQFCIYYQAQICPAERKIIGAEALIRWQHPEYGVLTPRHFLEQIQDLGLISKIGLKILRESCFQAKAWQNQGFSDMSVAVNVSPLQFTKQDFVKNVESVLNEAELPGKSLELEITEDVFIKDIKSMVKKLNQLSDLGVRIAIDDFGKHYSSLNYLQHLPVNKLKIDRSFISVITEKNSFSPIVNNIIKLGQEMQLTVVAEGVETGIQAEYLIHQKCDVIQGNYYATPCSSLDFISYLKRNY